MSATRHMQRVWSGVRDKFRVRPTRSEVQQLCHQWYPRGWAPDDWRAQFGRAWRVVTARLPPETTRLIAGGGIGTYADVPGLAAPTILRALVHASVVTDPGVRYAAAIGLSSCALADALLRAYFRAWAAHESDASVLRVITHALRGETCPGGIRGLSRAAARSAARARAEQWFAWVPPLGVAKTTTTNEPLR